MSKYIPGNQKHLTLNDRIYIENELSKGATFKDIAAFLCKDPTTISKEVKSRRLSDPASAAPKRPDCYSVDRTGTVTLSDPDQSSGTGYVCPLHVHIHR